MFGNHNTPQAGNTILAKGLNLSMDPKVSNRDNNVLVFGKEGSGKLHCVALPNILEGNSNLIITDATGVLYANCKMSLEKQGYDIKKIDLLNTAHSDHFNPFKYIRHEADINFFVDSFIKSTNKDHYQGNDPFWTNSELLLLKSVITLLVTDYPMEERNLSLAYKVVNLATSEAKSEDGRDALDKIFSEKTKNDPNDPAFKQYEMFKKIGGGKTRKSVALSLALRFNSSGVLDTYAPIFTDGSDLELEHFADKKTALFITYPSYLNEADAATSLILTQAFTYLYLQRGEASKDVPDKQFFPHIRLICDNERLLGLFPCIDHISAVVRKYNMSIMLLTKDMEELCRAFGENDAHLLASNFDSYVYLDSPKEDMIDVLSKMFENEKSTTTSSEFKTKVRDMTYNQCLVSIRGREPVIADKYNPVEHPNYVNF